MSSLKIMDYNVDFPYENPYKIQIDYMGKVIECLHNRVHGVLESPTGTGKTLCLLAPISAWVKTQKISRSAMQSQELAHVSELDLPDQKVEGGGKESMKWGSKTKSIVWYTARTHSQIAQTMAEVRKCNIQGLNIRVLGARDQLCINSDVLQEKESYIKTLKCKELIKSKSCKYHRRLNQERDAKKYYRPGQVMDIEDLITTGKTCEVCPYYLSKLQLETADIVFLPYNYIIDKESRDANSLQFEGDVVVFDEGHNVPNTCEESYEFTFTSMDLALGIKNVKELMMMTLHEMSQIAIDDDELDIEKHAGNSVNILEMLQNLEIGLKKLKVSDELLPVSELYDFFKAAGITSDKMTQITHIVEDFHSDSSKLNLSGGILSTFNLLEKMSNTIFGSSVKSFDNETIDRSFKWGVTMDPERVNKCKRVSLYCFNPSFGIRSILQLGVQSIIITSGTLSPLKTFIYELSLPKPITLQNGHIAKKSQVPFLILGTGINNVLMDASYNNRSDPKYVYSLGMTLINLIASVPDGVLLLFSSYSMMNSLKEAWEGDSGIWKRLTTLKRVFEEPRGKDEFINCMENYKRAIDSGNGAVLMGVLRGKISEGMDFKDHYCRAVFIVGVPFPPVKDPRVRGKEKYAESLTIFNPETRIKQKLYTNTFISVEAMRATNQAIGRVIRHGQDYGAIILVDYRFSWLRLFSNISGWLRGERPEHKTYQEGKKTLSDFFRDIYEGQLGVPEIRCQRVNNNGCPIPSNVKYEEYENRKVPRDPVPWIKAGVSKESNSKSRIPASTANIQYENDNLDQIVSLYSSQSCSSPETNNKQPKSMFEAMESCKPLCPEYGCVNMKEEDDKTPKRKFEDDKSFVKTCCLDADSEKKRSPLGKIQKRIKIHSFAGGDGRKPECVDLTGSGDNKNVTKTETKTTEEKDDLKMNLIKYFKCAKERLSQQEDNEFKQSAASYMKGMKSLLETIPVLDRIFSEGQKKELYSGFTICVKRKDREEWEKVCRARKINVSQ